MSVAPTANFPNDSSAKEWSLHSNNLHLAGKTAYPSNANDTVSFLSHWQTSTMSSKNNNDNNSNGTEHRTAMAQVNTEEDTPVASTYF